MTHKLPKGEYMLIPCIYQPGIELSFFLTAFSNQPVKFEHCKEWNTVSIEGEWKESRATAGGCGNTPTWKNNDQYRLVLDKNCKVLVLLYRTTNVDDDIYNGFYILKPECKRS